MNSEEFQTPKPTDEPLMTNQEQEIQSEQPDQSSVESVVEISASNPQVETQDRPASVLSVSDVEPTDITVGSTEESTTEGVTQLEQEIPTLRSNITSESDKSREEVEAAQRLQELQRQEQALRREIVNLQASYKTLQSQLGETQMAMSQLVQEALSQLEQRKQALQISVEQLERRQERIRNEMRTTLRVLPKI